MWSTSAAAAGQNPCVPVPAGETYYNASPDRAIYVADVGTTFTVDISGFTDVPRDSWELFAVDGTPSATSYLSLAFVGGVDGGVGRTTLPCDVNNQTKAQLQVTLLADPASGGLGEADGVLFSDDVMNEWTPSGGPVQVPYQVWPFAVVTPAEAAELGITDAGVTDNVRPRELRPVSSGPSLGAMPGKFVLRR
jgi:hypothetical protein